MTTGNCGPNAGLGVLRCGSWRKVRRTRLLPFSITPIRNIKRPPGLMASNGVLHATLFDIIARLG